MEESLIALLVEGIMKIDPGILQGRNLENIVKYYDILVKYNPTLKLVGAEGKELITKHFLDCLAPVPAIKQIVGDKQIKAADLGSGNGLPGVLLGFAFPKWDLSLVDRMGRRISFLLGAVASTGLAPRVKVVEKDLEKLDDRFDAVVFRAFRPFKDIAEDLNRIVVPGGHVMAFKSSEENISEELKSLEEIVPGSFETSVVGYNVPFLDAKRSLLVLKKL